MPANPPAWYPALIDILCELYKIFGGDCKSIFNPANPAPTESGRIQDAVNLVRDRIQQQGYPGGPEASELDKYATTLKSLASDPDNTLSSSSKANALSLSLAILDRVAP